MSRKIHCHHFGIPVLLLSAALAAGASPPPGLNIKTLPMVFNRNVGTDETIRFTSHGPGYGISFTPQEAFLLLSKAPGETAALRLAVLDARPDVVITGVDESPGKVNYLIGNDPSKWRTGIATYGKVAYQGVLPGVDLIYYGRGRQLEYDFRVSPGVDPRHIKMAIGGEGWRARVDSSGDLEIAGPGGSVRFARPVAYQVAVDGTRQPVEARYALKDGRRFAFKLSSYDHKRELVIDPSLVYSTFYGGTNTDLGNGIAIDGHGNTYIVGSTASTDLPGTSAGYQSTSLAPIGGSGGNTTYTAFVAKFDSTGQQTAATFLGGSTTGNFGNGIAVDRFGDVTVVGQTRSTDFPLKNATQSTCSPANKIDNFHCTVTPISNCIGTEPFPDAFVTKLSSDLSSLVYSTYLGGTEYESAGAVTVNSAGEAFVLGTTGSFIAQNFRGICGPSIADDSLPFPVTANAFYSGPATGGVGLAGSYAFLTKLSKIGAIEYSTYFGPELASGNESSETIGSAIALDRQGNAYIAGQTDDPNFPSTIPGTVTTQCNTCNDGSHWNAWAAKLNLNNSGSSQLIYNNLFGGSKDDEANGIAVDSQNNAYVAGTTKSTDFPTTAGAWQPVFPGPFTGQAGFAVKLNSAGTSFNYATYVGGTGDNTLVNGIAVDANGDAVVIGETFDSTFPTLDQPQTGCGSGDCGYLVQLKPDGSNTLFATYFGNFAAGNAVAIDGANNAYITGNAKLLTTTTGNACPNLNNCSDPDTDAFVAEINMGGCAADDSSHFGVTRGGMRFVFASQEFLQTVTIKNNSGGSIAAPIFLVLTNLSSDATLANSTGLTGCTSSGNPYITALASGSLASGQSLAVPLQFADPSKGGITYFTSVVAGGLP